MDYDDKTLRSIANCGTSLPACWRLGKRLYICSATSIPLKLYNVELELGKLEDVRYRVMSVTVPSNVSASTASLTLSLDT